MNTLEQIGQDLPKISHQHGRNRAMDNCHKSLDLIAELQTLNEIDKQYATTHEQRNAWQHLIRVLLDELEQSVRYGLCMKAQGDCEKYPDVSDIPF